MTDNLLSLPHEILHSILVNIDPQDLASLSCCRYLKDFIKNNRLLHRELYLRTFVWHSLQVSYNMSDVSWN